MQEQRQFSSSVRARAARVRRCSSRSFLRCTAMKPPSDLSPFGVVTCAVVPFQHAELLHALAEQLRALEVAWYF